MAKATVYFTEQRKVEFEVPDRPEDDDANWLADIIEKAAEMPGALLDVTETDVWYNGKQVY